MVAGILVSSILHILVGICVYIGDMTQEGYNSTKYTSIIYIAHSSGYLCFIISFHCNICDESCLLCVMSHVSYVS